MKRVTKHQVGGDVRGEICPPLQDVGGSGGGVLFDAGDGQVDSLTDNGFPLFSKVSLTESAGEQFPPRSMVFGVGHVEDSVDIFGVRVEKLIPFSLEETGANTMNLFEACWVVDGDLVRSNAYYWAILFV